MFFLFFPSSYRLFRRSGWSYAGLALFILLVFDSTGFHKNLFAPQEGSFRNIAAWIQNWRNDLLEEKTLWLSNSNNPDYLNFYHRRMDREVNYAINRCCKGNEWVQLETLLSSPDKKNAVFTYGLENPKEVEWSILSRFPFIREQKGDYYSGVRFYEKQAGENEIKFTLNAFTDTTVLISPDLEFSELFKVSLQPGWAGQRFQISARVRSSRFQRYNVLAASVENVSYWKSEETKRFPVGEEGWALVTLAGVVPDNSNGELKIFFLESGSDPILIQGCETGYSSRLNMLHSTRGIVLKSIKYSETSVISTIYTRKFGLQTYMINGVRSVKSRNRQTLVQPLTLLEMVVYHRSNKNLQRVKELAFHHLFHSMPFNIIKSSQGLFLSEILTKSLKEEEKDETLYDFIEGEILRLDEMELPDPDFQLHFLGRFADHLGFAPHPPEGPFKYFDLREGNFTNTLPPHNDYFKGARAEGMALLSKAVSNREKLPVWSSSQRRKILEVVLRFYTVHLPSFGTVRSLPILSRVLGRV